jgi:hypothetical protein
MVATPDPAQGLDPSQIPPPGNQFIGSTSNGLVDVYSGTLAGDIDAQPAARELLGTSLDTRGVSNAEYVYAQVKALYGGTDLPSFPSPSDPPSLPSPSGNSVKAVVFVSGSAQGGYGAFHGGNTQFDLDRIVVDSLNASGNYSAGSGMVSMAPIKSRQSHLFPLYLGPSDLLGVLHSKDARLGHAKPAAIVRALRIAQTSGNALSAALETRNGAAVPAQAQQSAMRKTTPDREALVHANQMTIGLLDTLTRAGGGRQYLSTALFCAEIVESFQTMTKRGDPGHTDGEAVSRVVAFKLTPEVALVPGFNSGATHQWWLDGHPDYVSTNTENDRSEDGNGAGMMFLLFLNDYLGVPLDAILAHMPATNGAALAETYAALLPDFPALSSTAGANGAAAFQSMVTLLQQNALRADGSLNLPADGNPFPTIAGSQQGGLFTAAAGAAPVLGTLAQDTQAAIGLEQQIEQQLASLKAALLQVRSDITPPPAGGYPASRQLTEEEAAQFGYGPQLVTALAASLEQRVEAYRAPHFDQSLQTVFWPHVYDETPGSGPHSNRLQVITGTNQAPVAIQISGTVNDVRQEDDGDLHIIFQPDDPAFPQNQDPAEHSPLVIEVIYDHRPNAKGQNAIPAEAGYTNPFDDSQLGPGARLLAAGPLIYDLAHGRPSSDGQNVDYGLEIHPLVGMSILSGTPNTTPARPTGVVQPSGQISSDVDSAIGQTASLNQALGNLSALLQKIQGEARTQ